MPAAAGRSFWASPGILAMTTSSGAGTPALSIVLATGRPPVAGVGRAVGELSFRRLQAAGSTAFASAGGIVWSFYSGSLRARVAHNAMQQAGAGAWTLRQTDARGRETLPRPAYFRQPPAVPIAATRSVARTDLLTRHQRRQLGGDAAPAVSSPAKAAAVREHRGERCDETPSCLGRRLRSVT